ncbi:MAG: DJ-1/PfpI family protein [Treponema sp.]|jgi:4-methyl-5(b-hydroxyethyl)-thiazole monophosphate biosynthesis|nr:DJ-1/PfpI family protein [Treponema sp.]
MQKNVIVLLAEGFEEVEALTPVDYIRRAGIEVLTVAVGEGRTVKGARGIPVIADTTLKECQGKAEFWDAVILPGGMPGAAKLAASEETCGLLKKMAAAGKWLCAICAAPALVLAPLGLLSGRRFTCYPGMETKVQAGEWSQERVVVSGNPTGGGIITSRGAGTAGAFAVAIIGQLLSEAQGEKIAKSVLLY